MRPRRALAEERKIVTVLFVDLVGFTARSEQLDPEDVRAIQTPYFARVREAIESFGGTVEKYIGDAVMAVFGAPVAHGDDPERAVRAALALLDAVEQLNGASTDLDLQVRIAVNTGEALVSLAANAAQSEGIVAGDVVNTAARLAVGCARERDPRRRGDVPRDAFGDRVRGCRAGRREGQAAAGPRLACGRGTRGSGGTRVWAGADARAASPSSTRCADIWARVTGERRPQLVTLFGPAGIGKSRLTAEFSQLVAADGARVIRGRSLPYGGVTPYGSFAAQVKQIAGMFDTDPDGRPRPPSSNARRSGSSREMPATLRRTWQC